MSGWVAEIEKRKSPAFSGWTDIDNGQSSCQGRDSKPEPDRESENSVRKSSATPIPVKETVS
jgi:hypothetical protein